MTEFCVRVHAHVTASNRFTAFLKVSSAILAAIMGRPHECDLFEQGAEDRNRPVVADPVVIEGPKREDMH